MYKVKERNIELGAKFFQRWVAREFEVAKGFHEEFSLVSYEPTHFHMEGSRERLAAELNYMNCQGLVEPLNQNGEYTTARLGAKYIGIKLHSYADTHYPFETSMVVSGIVSWVNPTKENWSFDLYKPKKVSGTDLRLYFEALWGTEMDVVAIDEETWLVSEAKEQAREIAI